MFDFLKKNDSEVIRREDVDCICTINQYPSRSCNIEFGEEIILIEFEEGNMEIPYSKIKSSGEFLNTDFGIKEAMDKKILSPEVMQSPGFLAGNFYTLTNKARIFLYIKFEWDRGSIQTLLLEYDKGSTKALKFIEKKKKEIRSNE